MRRTIGLLFIILPLLAVAPLEAAWTRAGLYGADVRALVVDPAHPDTVYLGTSQGEVYRSLDGGKSWTNPRGSTPFPGYVVDNLEIDLRGRLWAACWGLWGGSVIAVSNDGGKTWFRRDEGLRDQSIRALALDSSDSHSLVAGGLGGIWRSSDEGKSWVRISDQENVESLAVDPRHPDTIYVGTWRQTFRTVDGGKTWKRVAEGMVLDTDVFAIHIDPANPDRVWLATCGWTYCSLDQGEKWVRYRDGFDNRRIHDVAIDPNNPDTIYAGSVAGLYRSTDAGKKFALISTEDLTINAIALHRDRPRRIILGTEGDGVYVSNDGGATFQRSSEGLYNVKVAAVAGDPNVEGRIYAAVYFGGAASGIYQSDDEGRSWRKINETRLPEILSLVVRRSAAPRYLAGTDQGVFWSEDGTKWTKAEPAMDPIRFGRIVPWNGARLFAATTDGVYTSRDSGRSWSRLGDLKAAVTDLTIGTLRGRPVLLTLTADGLSVFDGETWRHVDGSPTGRTVGFRKNGDREIVIVAGSKGLLSGSVDPQFRWNETQAQRVAPVAVYQQGEMPDRLVVAAEGQKKLLVNEGRSEWRTFSLPAESATVGTVALDPFNGGRIVIGTDGQGVFIWNGQPSPSEATTREAEKPANYFAGGAK
ncbi:MAG: YCF48-related protein [Thermoanaerobaculia bacterium]